MSLTDWRRQVKLTLLFIFSIFLSLQAPAKSTKKPASIEPFASFYGKYLISNCQNSGQLLMDHCNYKYLIVSRVDMIGASGLPVPAVKFRYMSQLGAGTFLDNSLAILKNQKDTTYVEEKDSSKYKQSFTYSDGHLKSTEIEFIKNPDDSYRLSNKSKDIPAQGDSYLGETILTLKKL